MTWMKMDTKNTKGLQLNKAKKILFGDEEKKA